jgi:hypothetical protein
MTPEEEHPDEVWPEHGVIDSLLRFRIYTIYCREEGFFIFPFLFLGIGTSACEVYYYLCYHN